MPRLSVEFYSAGDTSIAMARKAVLGGPAGILNDNERKVVSFVQHRANASVKDLAKLTGCSDRVVRYSLANLIDRKVLTRQVYLDVYRLGLSYSTLFISLVPEHKKQAARLVQFLKASPRVSYFVALGGDFDFCVDVCVRETIELLDFMQELSGEFGALINKKSHTVMASLTDYPLDLQGGGRKGQKPLTCGLGSRKRFVIDQTDHGLLSHLSNSPELSLAELARKMGISKSTIEYRLQRLEKAGVVCGYRYLTNGEQLGLQSFIHCVYLRGVSGHLRSQLIQFCEKSPNIKYHLECAGDWDFEFGTSVYTAHEVISVVNELQDQFGNVISKVKTIPLFLHHKVSKYPFPVSWPVERVFAGSDYGK